jgi:hypothetical protein
MTVTLTGAAGASTPEPSGEAVIVTCEDGKAKVRPATEEDRARLEAVRAGEAEPGARVKWSTLPPGAKVVTPAEGDVAFEDLPPDAKRVKVLHAGPGGKPGEKMMFACRGVHAKPQE